jgi:outer membrane protein OmpA-like peptidoglycan-associated protein
MPSFHLFLTVSLLSLRLWASDPAAVIPAAKILQRLDAEIVYEKSVTGKDLTVQEERAQAREIRQMPLSSIRFKFNSTELADAQAEEQVRQLAAAILKVSDQGAVFTLEGHTCDIGDDAANLDLSQRRAEAVKLCLTKWLNIPASRLRTVGRGESSPQLPNGDEAARQQNRRVTIIREP